VNLTPGEALDK